MLPVAARAGIDVILTPAWYVTFEIHKRGLFPRPRSPRETKTFATEAEAKIFARAKLDEGLVVFAGTINPHLPRQTIAPERILGWTTDACGTGDRSTQQDSDE